MGNVQITDHASDVSVFKPGSLEKIRHAILDVIFSGYE